MEWLADVSMTSPGQDGGPRPAAWAWWGAGAPQGGVDYKPQFLLVRFGANLCFTTMYAFQSSMSPVFKVMSKSGVSIFFFFSHFTSFINFFRLIIYKFNVEYFQCWSASLSNAALHKSSHPLT